MYHLFTKQPFDNTSPFKKLKPENGGSILFLFEKTKVLYADKKKLIGYLIVLDTIALEKLKIKRRS